MRKSLFLSTLMFVLGLSGLALAQDGEASFEASVDADGAAADADMGGAEGGITAYTARGLTLDKGTLRIDVGPGDRALLQRGAGFVVNETGSPLGAFINLNAGAGFGIIDNLEAGVVILPLGLAPSGVDVYGDPTAYGRYQLLDGDTQLAVQVDVLLPASTFFGFGVAVPVKFALGENMHLNTGARFGFRDTPVTATLSIEVPVEFAVNIMPALFFGLATGLNIRNLDIGFDSGAIPLEVFAGYTMGLAGHQLDITAGFGFPGFLSFGPGASNPVADVWQLTIGGNFHMDIL
ncbi:MAG: hypothetical protein KC416_13070 [Myxococcales bacterium]|nr:hypothetical protein [Myxococcales bacterium]